MAIARHVATEATLRDNRALAEYCRDLQTLFLTLSVELPMIARASGARLRHQPAANSMMSHSEKQAAAAQVKRSLARAAAVLRYASKQVAIADGVMVNVFTPRRNNRNNRNRPLTNNGNQGRANNNAA